MKIYVFLFSPRNSILNSNYSMKSETVSTGKTDSSVLIKIRYPPRLKKGQMRGLLPLGDCSNSRGHSWPGGRDPLWTDRDPASEMTAGNGTGHSWSVWPDFRTTKLSENQRWGPHILLLVLCGTRTRRLLHKKQYLETIAEAALDGTGLSYPFKI